ncbi:HRDC domain-containing protein [Arsenicicoccus sp. oral taxon 190]|uniref:HRDC domain-containing protein n=1 Tax=Arsenicicoccus sp. oral taxon 190 TaxID=1658671 RepID=UPI00067A1435|nr:HRDC domain-containing protein [Arsenicicoccus sp. oral taxon 190]AKT51992.1 3'-5' exonuclease [Arsenicicoccus sp. oral taxon 190]
MTDAASTDTSSTASDETASVPRLVEAPEEPLRPVVEDERALRDLVAAVAAGHGPVALDAERASGFRYGQKAYLVQLRRAGAGTWLIDPVMCPDLSELQAVIRDEEWVLHAATQDLPCLGDLGLTPTRLFDTELGSRLAGRPRVGLAAAMEHYLGVTLAKEHSAQDWSTRPLPAPWLVYAALDVELLVELRDAVDADLRAQGKSEWAAQEFEALTHFRGPAPRVDPWRRTSGLHKVRTRRGLAVVRELWLTRDGIAQDRDCSPGRVLPDAALLDLATNGAGGRLPRAVARHPAPWLAAIDRAMLVPERDLPPQHLPADGPPPQRAWADKDPVAAARLVRVKELVTGLSESLQIPAENLLTPDSLRRVVWAPPLDESVDGFREILLDLGARPWQTELVAPLLAETAAEHPYPAS